MNLEQRKAWNANHKKLTKILLNPAEHDRTIDLFLNQHALLYSSAMAGSGQATLEDELVKEIREETIRQYPVHVPDTRNSIAWHVWHITRIEDMTMNVLVHGGHQILHEQNWLEKMKIAYEDSGNGMNEEEAAHVSKCIDIEALFSYRLAVGRRTREIIRSLQPGQFKHKVDPSRLNTLKEQGAVRDQANWLLEYWGGKSIAGLVLMPATRHNFLHLNKSIRIKHRLQK